MSEANNNLLLGCIKYITRYLFALSILGTTSVIHGETITTHIAQNVLASIVGRGGSLVESIYVDWMVVGSNSAVAAT